MRCNDCSECCHYVALPLPPSYEKHKDIWQEWADTRQLEIINGHLRIPNVCPHLKNNKCSIYETRPFACKTYDGRKDPSLKDKCKLTYFSM